MGDRDVDEIIAKWRDSARAAGEPDAQSSRPDAPQARIRSIRGRWPVILAGLVAITALGTWLLSVGGPADVDGVAGASGIAASPSPSPLRSESELAPPTEPALSGAATPPEFTLADDWYALVEKLDRARETAYRSVDGSALGVVFEAGSEAYQHETALIAELSGRGLMAQGWRTEILAVSPISSTETDAQVRVIDSRAAYRLVGSDGAETEVPAAGPVTWLIDFTKADGHWLVTQVTPDPTSVTIPSGQP